MFTTRQKSNIAFKNQHEDWTSLKIRDTLTFIAKKINSCNFIIRIFLIENSLTKDAKVPYIIVER